MAKPIIEPSTGKMWACAADLAQDIGCAISTVRLHATGRSPMSIFGRKFQYAAIGKSQVKGLMKSREWRYVLERHEDDPYRDRVRIFQGSKPMGDYLVEDLCNTIDATPLPADGWQWRVFNMPIGRWSPWQYGRVLRDGKALLASPVLEERPLYALETLGAANG